MAKRSKSARNQAKPTTAPAGEKIVDTEITQELGEAYLSYSMSVIVGRALPDVRDGLKPVHRRILYAMKTGGYAAERPPRKSARIVGDVMGQFHPHGDSAIYDAMARMAQDFSMSMPLIDGQGNFGSVDGDPPAAMRYTEARLARAADGLLDEVDKETVDWTPNYDGETLEPRVLPAAFPNLLVNGSEGIAVGMATRIPPHNAGETIRAAIHLLTHPEATLAEVMAHLPAPDFPTGGVAMGLEAIRTAYETGRGSFKVRARHTFEEAARGRTAIVFDQLPYQVNKSKLVEAISQLVRDKKIEGIAEVRDESDRNGIRLVVEVRQDANADVILARLHKETQLQTSVSINALALDASGRPQQMSLLQILQAFLDFRQETVRRRTLHELRKDRARAHTLAGLLIALANIDRVVAVIRAAQDSDSAIAALIAEPFEAADLRDLITRADPKSQFDGTVGTCRLTEAQARAILDLKLHRLTGLERERLEAESRTLIERVARAIEILSDRAVLKEQVRKELEQMLDKLDAPRRTEVQESFEDYDVEDLIPRADMVVTLTRSGYVKRVPLADYRAQARNGKGRTGMSTKDDDVVTRVIAASTHTPLLLFTDRGTAYKIKVHQLPEGGPQSRGRPIVNMIDRMQQDETIAAILTLPEDTERFAELQAAFVTETGRVRRNTLADFARVPANGKIAMKLRDDDGKPIDRLVDVLLHDETDHIALTTRMGQVIRFPANDVRIFNSRQSTGVRGIRLKAGDAVISAMILADPGCDGPEAAAYLTRAARDRRQDPGDGDDVAEQTIDETRYRELAEREQMILTVMSRGYGRRTSAYAYRTTARDGQGVRDCPQKRNVGEIVGAAVVDPDQDVVLVTDKGQIIRTPVRKIRLTGRGAAGVRLFNMEKDEQIVGFSCVRQEEAPTASGVDTENQAEVPEPQPAT